MTALQKPATADFATARFHMVESQIRPNKVRDGRILDIMGALPREVFVPPSMMGIAYIDEDIQVAAGRYLLEPMVLARLLEEVGVGAQDRILDIAPATGYSTAVIAALAPNVIALESDPALHKQAIANLASLQIKNADVQLGPLLEGYAAKAPYNIILINGGVEIVPAALLDQLAEGGRLVAVVRQYGPGHAAHTGEARLYEKTRGVVSHRSLFDANIKLLPGFQAPAKFSF